MVACFRKGDVALPVHRAVAGQDLRLRLDVAAAAAVVADERNAAALARRGWDGPTRAPGASARRARAAGRRARARRPVPDHVHVRHAGEPKAVLHGQRYLTGQQLQAEHWLAARAGDLVWCTAASGWSKSARNVFIAPWIRGAAALLHDARFDPHERLELVEREPSHVLCMAPTEYRVIAKRAEPRAVPGLRGLVAAGEALDPAVLGAGTRPPASRSATATARPRPAR